MIQSPTYQERLMIKRIQRDAWCSLTEIQALQRIRPCLPGLSFIDLNPLHGAEFKNLLLLLRDDANAQGSHRRGPIVNARRWTQRTFVSVALSCLGFVPRRRPTDVCPGLASIHYLRANEDHTERLVREMKIADIVANREGAEISTIILLDTRTYLRRILNPTRRLTRDLRGVIAPQVIVAKCTPTDVRRARRTVGTVQKAVRQQSVRIALDDAINAFLIALLRAELKSGRLIETLCLGAAVDRCIDLNEVTGVIYPWENQPWERLLLTTANRRGLQTHGICFTVVQANQWPLFDGRLGVREFHPRTLNFQNAFWASEFRRGNDGYEHPVYSLSGRHYKPANKKCLPLEAAREFKKIYVIGCIDGPTTIEMLERAYEVAGPSKLVFAPHPAGSRRVIRRAGKLRISMTDLRAIDHGLDVLLVLSHNTAALEEICQYESKICRFIPDGSIDRGFSPFVEIPEAEPSEQK